MHKYISECTSTTVEPVGTATAYKLKAHPTPSVQKRTNSLTHGRGGGGTGTSSLQVLQSEAAAARAVGAGRLVATRASAAATDARGSRLAGATQQTTAAASMATRAHVSNVGINTYQRLLRRSLPRPHRCFFSLRQRGAQHHGSTTHIRAHKGARRSAASIS